MRSGAPFDLVDNDDRCLCGVYFVGTPDYIGGEIAFHNPRSTGAVPGGRIPGSTARAAARPRRRPTRTSAALARGRVTSWEPGGSETSDIMSYAVPAS